MAQWLERLTKPSPTMEAPSKADEVRTDIAMAVTILFCLFLGLGLRGQVLNAGNTASLDKPLPQIKYPATWRPNQSEDATFAAVNPGSPSTFNSRLTINARPAKEGETVELARAEAGLRNSGSLSYYRELSVDRMEVLDGVPALLTTYAYVADPTRDAGANGLPVVVEAQELLFIHEGRERASDPLVTTLMAVTLEADATDWEASQSDFAVVFNSLQLREETVDGQTSPAFDSGSPAEGGLDAGTADTGEAATEAAPAEGTPDSDAEEGGSN